MMITTKPGSKHARQMGRATAAATCMMFFVLCACGRKEAPPAAKPHRPRMEPKRAVERIENKEIEPLAVPEPGGLRPVRVTVLEYGSPAGEADVWIEHFSPTSSWWHARTRGDGRATLLVPIEYTWFRVSASKVPNAIAAQFMRDLPQRAEPLDVTLNMTNQGVVITALLEAARPAMLSNVTVRIRPSDEPDWEDVSIARVPHTSGPRVVLPPVRRGLRGLRVEVMGPHIPASYSDYFDTLDGQDKTIRVQLLEGVRVYGTARLADGSAAGTFTLFGTPAGTHGLAAGAGVVRETLTTDAAGAYECTQFVADFYRVDLQCERMYTIRTNVLVSDDDTQFDVVFSPQATLQVRGRVLAERTRQPVPGAIVRFQRDFRATYATTDVSGAFAMLVPYEDQFYGSMHIDHAEYAHCTYHVHEKYASEEIIMLLHDTAVITGTVRYEDGQPAANVSVAVSAHEEYGQNEERSRAVLGAASYEKFSLEKTYRTQRASDASGMYVISNVAAPASYFFSIESDTCCLIQPAGGAPAVQVTPGEIGRYDVVVQAIPRVFVKVCDAGGAVLRSYELAVEYSVIEGDHTQQGSAWLSANPNADGWQYLDVWQLRNRSFLLNVRVVTPDGAVAATNNLRYSSGGEHYLILSVTSNATRSMHVCGYVYNEDNEPLEDVSINAQYGWGSSKTVQTDHMGFFEVLGSGAPISSMVRLTSYYRECWHSTNISEGTEPFVWVFATARKVSGRVCLERPGQPASNSMVSLRLRGRQEPAASDGRFTLYLPDDQDSTGEVYAWVADYAPAMKPFTCAPDKDVDIGDIVVLPVSSSVRGRVVNERGAPLRARVELREYPARYTVLSTETHSDDGNYEFLRLPTGAYVVTVHQSDLTDEFESEVFTLSAGQDCTVPDIVCCTTNAVFVRLVFVKADGTPAARMDVSELSRPTDAHGAIEAYVRLGTHKKWSLSDHYADYYTAPFEITPASREVRVSLAPVDLIQGTVTLDGAPLAHASVTLESITTSRACNVKVFNGVFVKNMEPGAYYATYEHQALVTKVHLAAGADNHIAFVSGDAALTVTVPAGGTWYGWLGFHMDGHKFSAGYWKAGDVTAQTFERLLPGTYTVSVGGWLHGVWSNMACEVQLSPGQRASVAF